MADKKLQDQDVSEIDRALAAVKARKLAKAAGGGETTAGAAKDPPGAKKPRLTDEEKAAKIAARDAERANRKTANEVAAATKKAERLANKQPAHMKKVQRAAEKLGSLGQAAMFIFNDATTNLTAAELTMLALHISHFNRVKATERALSAEIAEGTKVKIVGGDPRFIGETGTVVKTQRIRCYVNIPGANNRPVPGTSASGVYFFTSDVSPVVEEEEDAEETEGGESTAPEEVAVATA